MMCGPGQNPLSILALDEFTGCSLCNAPAHNPDCQDTSQAPTRSPRGAGTQSFASCQRRISGPPICAITKNQSPSPWLPSGGTAAWPTLTLRFQPQEATFPKRQLAASPEHQHLCLSFFPEVLAQATLVQPAIHSMGIPTDLPAAIPVLEGMQSLLSISHRCRSS